MEKHQCKPSLTRYPLRGRNCCRPRSAGHKSSSDTRHDEEPVVRSSANFYSLSMPSWRVAMSCSLISRSLVRMRLAIGFLPSTKPPPSRRVVQ